MKIIFLKSSQEERQIPLLTPCKTSHNFFWKPTKWQEEKLKTPKLQNSKTKNAQNSQEQSNPPFAPKK